MACYRYVTPVLHGRWRNTRQEALVDAMRAGQARAHPGRPGDIVMLCDVRIEERPAEAGEASGTPGAGF